MFQRRISAAGQPYRLVVETDDPALQASEFRCYQQAGFDVVVCHGPDGTHPCPAATGLVCEAIEGADVVLNALRDADTQRVVVGAVRATAPGVPMVVNVADAMSDDDLPEGCVRLTRTVSVAGLTDAVRRAAIAGRAVTRR